MHAFKPLIPLAGRSLILHTLDSLQASSAISDIFVITGHRSLELQAALPPFVTPIFNPNYAAGEMLSSIQTGIRALAAQNPASPPPAFLLALADQPAVAPQTIQTLVHSFFASAPHPPLVIPSHLGKKGHPMVISWSLVPAILALPPGETLRTVVQHHLPQARVIPVDDPWVLEDLDTPEDLARVQSTWSPARRPAN
jgi:molybdenum cofactor cytidylyltransferase